MAYGADSEGADLANNACGLEGELGRFRVKGESASHRVDKLVGRGPDRIEPVQPARRRLLASGNLHKTVERAQRVGQGEAPWPHPCSITQPYHHLRPPPRPIPSAVQSHTHRHTDTHTQPQLHTHIPPPRPIPSANASAVPTNVPPPSISSTCIYPRPNQPEPVGSPLTGHTPES